MSWSAPAILLALLFGSAGQVAGQGYRVRFDARLQSVAFRGVELDSIAASSAVVGSGGGLETPDGIAVRCLTGANQCTFFRPGATQRAGPTTTVADMTLWGLGVRGLRVRANARLGVDLGDSGTWPGTDPAAQLVEGYAEYSTARVTAQVGRTNVVSRFGFKGFDGAKVIVRPTDHRLSVSAFGGWALARGVALPVTSPALNPLDDFQPGQRHIVWGGGATWSSALVEARARYRREFDSRTTDVSSERVALTAAVRPGLGLTLAGGADYDIAAGYWGSAEVQISATRFNGRGSATAGVRRYRPHFDLWTIWGAFSPVAYRAAFAALRARPWAGFEIRARGEIYEFEDANAATPLVTVEDDGWRWSVDGVYSRSSQWSISAGWHRALGPGAGSLGYRSAVVWSPSTQWVVSVNGSMLERPLEFRFNDAKVWVYGADVRYAPSTRLRFGVSATRYDENRRRPDAAQFDWNQLRLNVTASVMLSSADVGLHPAILSIPKRRVFR